MPNIGQINFGYGQGLFWIILRSRVELFMKSEESMMFVLVIALTFEYRKKVANQLYRRRP